METIQDLVDFLNDKCPSEQFFYAHDDLGITLYHKIEDDEAELITFYQDEDYPAWIIRDMRKVSPRVQETIMDFAYNTDRNKWFRIENRFNIIMGYDVNHVTCVAYYWEDIGDRETITPTSNVYMDELDKDAFLFTEDDIEYIKSDMVYPQTLMIDLGVMEGKRRAKGDKQ